MARSDKDEIKNLPPEERIRKLRELEKKKQQEIAEMEKEIARSEEEITEREKWKEKVPIPEVTQEDEWNVSDDAKNIMRQVRGTKEVLDEDSVSEGEKDEQKSLEETVSEEAPLHDVSLHVEYKLPGELGWERLNAEYAMQLSYQPVDETRDAIQDIYSAVKKRGYMTWEEQDFVRHSLSGLEKKTESDYQWSKEAQKKASETRAVASHLLHKAVEYGAKAGKGEVVQKDWYKG